mmetsp:Transcript_3963/g.11985  ORF Transcript_3963/g.11985 Transcript_3963/m.11985 type:complete len:596 (+) Transcript_3963:89-1876(+)
MVRILLITYEYDAFTFSGNGTYAQGLVRGLRQQPGVVVEVACGSPFHDRSACVGCEGCVGGQRPPDGEFAHECERRPSSADVLVQLPRWCNLDGASAYRRFNELVIKALDERYKKKEQPDLVCCVDWHGLPACLHLQRSFPVAIVYLNFRVFGRQGEFLKSQETRCVDAAHLTLALSESDAVWFRTLKPLADVEVLLPPLRLDLERLARKRPKVKRDLLTCVVRLSAEKEPERFVRLVEHLAARKAFDEGHGYPENLRPVLITGRAELEGDSPLVKRFLAAHPAAEAYPYMTPRGLAELFGRTRLLVHPPAYDAFGMTVVEAAAFGAPSVFVPNADVGAKHALVVRRDDETRVAEGLVRSLDPAFGPDDRLGEGDKVEARHLGKEKYYPGKILRDRGDGTFDIAYDDDEAFFEIDMDDAHAGDCAPADRPVMDVGAMTSDQVRHWKKKHDDGVHEFVKLLKNEALLNKVGKIARKRAMGWTEAAHGRRLMGFLGGVAKDAEQEKKEYAAMLPKEPPKPPPRDFVSEWKEVKIEQPKDDDTIGDDSVDIAEKYGEIRYIPLENCLEGVPNMPPPPDTNPDLIPASMRPPTAPGTVL